MQTILSMNDRAEGAEGAEGAERAVVAMGAHQPFSVGNFYSIIA